MTGAEEFQPADDNLVSWDGTVLEIFQGQASYRYHVKAIEDLHVNEGRVGRGVLVKNRFGSDGMFSYDKERLPEVREFCDRVMAAAREQAPPG
jgi:hypothetical protein